MSGEPLPARILIPVANPLTAEELIRIGAALLEPRTGELSDLEALLGLDPAVERTGGQLSLFGG